MSKSSLWGRIKKYLPTTEVQYVYFLSAVVLAASFVLLLSFSIRSLAGRGAGSADSSPTPTPTPTPTAVTELPCLTRRLLDGVCVENDKAATAPTVGIMIENSYEAWPLSGLSAASVVYEAPVEGSIPRFLALYPLDAEVDKVGPVRSARPYYIDWMSEYGQPLYMHVGGSPDALEKLPGTKLIDVNEFYQGLYFWRAEERTAPHNTYTGSSLWQKAWKRYSKDASVSFSGWVFATSTPCAEECASTFTVPFLSPTYDVTWTYDATSTVYNRYQNRRRDRDETDTPITAATVIVQRVKASVVDDLGRLDLTTVGKGEALIFRDGRLIHGRWKKKNAVARTEWLDENGDAIALAPGKIWVEVLPTSAKVILPTQ